MDMDPDAPFICRLKAAAVMVAMLIVAPGVVGLLLGGPIGATGLIVGMLSGWFACHFAGTRHATWLVPLTAASLVVGGLTHGTWWWVAVPSILAAVAGWSLQWGMMPALALPAMVAVVARPVNRAVDVLVATLFVLVGGWLGARLAARSAAPSATRVRVQGHGALLAFVAVGAATAAACVVAHYLDDRHAYWIPLTVVVLSIPAAEGRRRYGGQYALGTLAGLPVLIPLAIWPPPAAVVGLLGLLCLVLIVAIEEPYWVHTLMVTLLILILASPGPAGVEVAERRLLFTLTGVVIVAVTGVVVNQVLARRASAAAADVASAT